jgi:hypothetical protein
MPRHQLMATDHDSEFGASSRSSYSLPSRVGHVPVMRDAIFGCERKLRPPPARLTWRAEIYVSRMCSPLFNSAPVRAMLAPIASRIRACPVPVSPHPGSRIAREQDDSQADTGQRRSIPLRSCWGILASTRPAASLDPKAAASPGCSCVGKLGSSILSSSDLAAVHEELEQALQPRDNVFSPRFPL